MHQLAESAMAWEMSEWYFEDSELFAEWLAQADTTATAVWLDDDDE